MAHGLNAMLKRGPNSLGCAKADGKTGIGSRRIFAPQFKLQVLDSYRNDADCKGNQRATARKYGIHRRQIQKWLQVEHNLRNSVTKSGHGVVAGTGGPHRPPAPTTMMAGASAGELLIGRPEAALRNGGLAVALRSGEQPGGRQRDDVCSAAVDVYLRQQHPRCPGATETEHERCSGGVGAAGHRALADKRVPDTPHGSAPLVQPTYEWQQRRGSPDTASSTTGSCCSTASDEVAACDARCECSAPLDFTTHTRRPASPLGGALVTHAAHAPPVRPTSVPPASLPATTVIVPTGSYSAEPSVAPMDLSLKRPGPHAAEPAPVCLPTISAPAPSCPSPPAPLPPRTSSPTHIWDLSTKGVKRRRDSDSSGTASPLARPVKLFKPYLDHVSDGEDDVKPQAYQQAPPAPVAAEPHTGYLVDSEYFYNNNNNGDYKMEYTFTYRDEGHFEARGHQGYGAAVGANEYYPNGGLHYIAAAHYAGDDMVHGPFVFGKHHVHAIKQRQSYSLDFKLSAIECYHRDAVCRGNQRAVASKFKIHRRQVQKWLKQEDQLRQRNETMKPMHIVR